MFMSVICSGFDVEYSVPISWCAMLNASSSVFVWMLISPVMATFQFGIFLLFCVSSLYTCSGVLFSPSLLGLTSLLVLGLSIASFVRIATVRIGPIGRLRYLHSCCRFCSNIGSPLCCCSIGL